MKKLGTVMVIIGFAWAEHQWLGYPAGFLLSAMAVGVGMAILAIGILRMFDKESV